MNISSEYYLFIKSKTIPNGHANKGTNIIFIFTSLLSVFRHLFQRSHLFRFKEPTNIVRLNSTQLYSFLSLWVQSHYNLDKLVNSCLPYPNNNTYTWKNQAIHQILHHSNSSKSMNPSSFVHMKKLMMDELLSDHDTCGLFIIEMRTELFNIPSSNYWIHFTISDYFNKQTKMNEVFQSQQFKLNMMNRCLFSSLQLFSNTIRYYNHPNTYLSSSSTSSSNSTSYIYSSSSEPGDGGMYGGVGGVDGCRDVTGGGDGGGDGGGEYKRSLDLHLDLDLQHNGSGMDCMDGGWTDNGWSLDNNFSL